MNVLYRVDSFLGKRIAWLVAGSLIIGILFHGPLSLLRRFATPLMAFMTFSNTLGGGFRELGQALRKPKPVIATLLSLHLVLPLVGLVIGGLLMPKGTLYGLGLTIQLCSPTAVSSMIWATMNGGNPYLCLTLVLIDTLMIPVVMPAMLRLLSGASVSLDTWSMMKDLLVMVAIPASIAMAAHGVFPEKTVKQVKSTLAPFAKLAMIVLLTGNATKCAPFLHSAASDMPCILLAVLTTCVFGYVWGYLLGRMLRQDYATVVTMTLNTGMRNNAVGSTLASTYFPAEAVFPAVIVPLFSQLTAAFMMRYVRKTANENNKSACP